MKKSILFILLIALSNQVYSQVIELPEIVITAVNYKYLNAVDTGDTALTIQMLEDKVAMFDLKSSEFYNDEYDTHYVSFYIPNGKILAAYDNNGKLIRTVERFKNVKLPQKVQNAITERFPNWTVMSDIYKVSFFKKSDVANKQYKVKLQNGDKTMRVKLDENGNYQ